MYKNFIKRIFDFLVALTALIVLSPIFILVMIGLFFANQGKPFFLQERPGKDERIFKIIKFKSMNDKTDVKGNLLPDAERLTPMGAFVRKTSLDEIPQLINVLKGDMSLIGPRPLLVRYLPFYTEEESLRHKVRPGITGWAQVNGRNTIGWDKRLAYDVEYVHQVSFVLDLKIIVKTIKNVLARKDIVIIPGKKGQLLDIARSKDKLVLRKLALKDLDLRVSWLNNKAINETMNLTLPILKEDTVNWFNKNQSNPDRVDLVLESSVELIGMTGFSNKSKGIVDSYTFMNPELKGKGYGTICLFMKMVYGFNIFGLVKTVSVIDFDNIASRKMVEKLGFKLIKVVENDLYKNDIYIDRCYYECTKEDFNYNYLSFTQYKGVVVYDPNDK